MEEKYIFQHFGKQGLSELRKEDPDKDTSPFLYNNYVDLKFWPIYLGLSPELAMHVHYLHYDAIIGFPDEYKNSVRE